MVSVDLTVPMVIKLYLLTVVASERVWDRDRSLCTCNSSHATASLSVQVAVENLLASRMHPEAPAAEECY